MAELELRLNHLWNASQQLFPHSPALSAFYAAKFREEAKRNQQPLAGYVERQMCPTCSMLNVPGLAITVKSMRSSGHNKRSRTAPSDIAISGDTDRDITKKPKKGRTSFLPSSLSSTDSTPSTATKKGKACRNFVQICRACGHKTLMQGPSRKVLAEASASTPILKKAPVQTKAKVETTTPTPAKASSLPTPKMSSMPSPRPSTKPTAPLKIDASSQKKKRKKTNSNLASLLAKSDANEAKKESKLNLSDFLNSF